MCLSYVVPSLLVLLNPLSWQLNTTAVFIDKAHVAQYKLVGLKNVLIIGKIIPGLQIVGSVIFYDFVLEQWLLKLMSCTGTQSLSILFLQPKIYHFMRRIKVREICEHTVSFLLRCGAKSGYVEAGRDGVLSSFIFKFPRSVLTFFLVRSQMNGEGQDAETLHQPSFSQRVWASSLCRALQTIVHVDPQASCGNTELSR